MKNKTLITLLLIACLMGGCTESKYKVITDKSFTGTVGNRVLPKCICEYEVNYGRIFQDSCSKYSVGDTIKTK